MKSLSAILTGLALLTLIAPAHAQGVAVTEELVIIEDVIIGDPDAPVLIEEYASMTCVHCATFSNEVFPDLKEQYIDTGKVKFVIKPFPIDNLSAGAFLLARCGTDDEYNERVKLMFATQDQWAFSNNPGSALLAILDENYGMTEDEYMACLSNRNALNWISMSLEEGGSIVAGTPTFVINGIVSRGNMPIENFAAIIDPML